MFRKTTLALLCVLLLSLGSTHAQSDFVNGFKRLSSTDVHQASHITRVSASGEEGYVITGLTGAGSSVQFVTKTDLWGNVVWQSNIGSVSTATPAVAAVDNSFSGSSQGDVYAAARSGSTMRVSRLDRATGALLAQRTVNQAIEPVSIKQFTVGSTTYFGILGTYQSGGNYFLSFTLVNQAGAVVRSTNYTAPNFAPNIIADPAAFELKSGTNRAILAYGTGSPSLITWEINVINGRVIAGTPGEELINPFIGPLHVLDIEEIPSTSGSGFDYMAVGSLNEEAVLIKLNSGRTTDWIEDVTGYFGSQHYFADARWNGDLNVLELLELSFALNNAPQTSNITRVTIGSLSPTLVGNTNRTDGSSSYNNNFPATFTTSPLNNRLVYTARPGPGAFFFAPIALLNGSYNVTGCPSNSETLSLNAKSVITFPSPTIARSTNTNTVTTDPWTVIAPESNVLCGSICTTPITGISISASGPGICATGGGSVDLTATVSSGGPYTYLWYPGGQPTQTATVTAAGTYTVKVSDPATGCTGTQTFNVVPDTDISMGSYSINPTGIICINDNPTGFSLTPSPTAVSPTYAWDFAFGQTSSQANPQVNFNANYGNRLVTLTYTNACGTLNVNTNVTLQGFQGSLAVTQPACNGDFGEICYNVSSSSATPTFNWSHIGPGSACEGNLTAGTYTVTVTSQTCSETFSATINAAPSALNVSSAVTPESCIGLSDGQITLTVTGGTPPYSYNWSGSSSTTNVASNLSAGNYSCTVTDANGCTEPIGPINIATPTDGIDFSTVASDNLCLGFCDGQIQLNPSFQGAVTGATYTWSNGATTPTISQLCDGAYSVTVTPIGGSCGGNYVFNFSLNALTSSDWQVYSEQSQNTTADDVETDDNGNVYVMGTFEQVASFNFGSVMIFSGGANFGMYVAKYRPCGQLEWVVATEANNLGDCSGVDIEYRNGEVLMLFRSEDMNDFVQLNAFDGGGGFIGSYTLAGAPPSAAGYIIGSLDVSASSITDFAHIDDGLLTNEVFTSIDFNGAPVVGGQNDGQFLTVAELEFTGTDYILASSGNYRIDPPPGDPENMVEDIEIVPGTSELFVTGKFNSNNPLGSSLIPAAIFYDAFIGAMDAGSLNTGIPTGADNQAEATAYAVGNALDVREVSSGNYEVAVAGDFAETLVNWNYSTASGGGIVNSGVDNAFVSYATYTSSSTTLSYSWSIDFEGSGFTSARGNGVAYDDLNNQFLAVGEYNSADLEVRNQPVNIPGSSLQDMWFLSLDNAGAALWLNGGLSNQGIRVAAIAASSGNGYTGGSYLEDIQLIMDAGTPIIPHANPSQSEMFVARGGNAYDPTQGLYYKTNQANTDQPVRSEEEALEDIGFSMMPNPTADRFALQFNGYDRGSWEVLIFSTTGQQVYQTVVGAGTPIVQDISLGDEAQGVYIVRIVQAGEVFTGRLVVY